MLQLLVKYCTRVSALNTDATDDLLSVIPITASFVGLNDCRRDKEHAPLSHTALIEPNAYSSLGKGVW